MLLLKYFKNQLTIIGAHPKMLEMRIKNLFLMILRLGDDMLLKNMTKIQRKTICPKLP